MASTRTLLYYGALLHDVGRVLRRAFGADDSQPAVLGADFITREVGALNESFAGDGGRRIAEQILWHNQEDLGEEHGLQRDSLAYITCFANSVTDGLECEDEGLASQAGEFKLRKIFNRLNGHCDDSTIEHREYASITESLKNGLAQMDVSSTGVNSLLWLLEEATSDIPASTNLAGLIDVPFYDHAKVTAGIAACVHEYLHGQGIEDYRNALIEDGEAREVPMFLLWSCDMSGIQDFIYNISGSGALKQLRARSMYLELLLEHVVDELLERLGLCRANLLYTGGGHAYMLLPNTAQTISVICEFTSEARAWFVDHYRTDLYLASAWVECSADDLANRGENKERYPMLYQRLSKKLSEAKARRYDAATIRALNFGCTGYFDHQRECSECHRSDLRLDGDGKCPLCAELGRISGSLVDKDVFTIERSETGRDNDWRRGLVLPFGCRLVMCTRSEYLARGQQAYRTYVKGDWNIADGAAVTHIWIGDYTADTQGEGMIAYAAQGAMLEKGKGIQRLGVLRADVDDLGATFVSGLPRENASIARTPTLSRAMSRFFKSEVNEVLRRSDYQVQIIYSGGDDLFIIGNWCDIIHAAVDIRKALDSYTGNGSITISAGIGIYDATYPIARMADETGSLEGWAKSHLEEGGARAKNAVCLWAADFVFGWDEFIDAVMPRVDEIRHLFEGNQKGSALMYKIIALLRSYSSAASTPRLAYLLARSFEDDRKRGGEASRKLYSWAQDAKERRCLVAALEWYVCSVREGRE